MDKQYRYVDRYVDKQYRYVDRLVDYMWMDRYSLIVYIPIVQGKKEKANGK